MKWLFIFFFGSWALLSAETWTGLTEPKYNLKLSFPVSGITGNVIKREGDQVQKDEVIMFLKQDFALITLQQRKIALGDHSKIQVHRDHLATTRDLLQSSQRLRDATGSISAEEVLKLQMQVQSLEGELNAALTQKDLEKLAHDSAKAKLEELTLKSPIDGMITEISRSTGEWCQSGEVIAQVVDCSICVLRIDVPAEGAMKMELGDTFPVSVHLEPEPIEKTARVIYIAPMADPSTGLVQVKLEFDNADWSIPPGLTASVLME